MLKFDSWPPNRENTSFSEGSLAKLEHAAYVFDEGDNDARNSSNMSVFRLGRECGQILMANVDINTAVEIANTLTANMRHELANGFEFGFGVGLGAEQGAGVDLEGRKVAV